MIPCSGCNGPTTPKQINTQRGPTTVYECQGNCKNSKGYVLGTFPPKVSKAPSGMQPQQGPSKQDEILRCLLRIENILANPKQVHVAEVEKQPDEEIPF